VERDASWPDLNLIAELRVFLGATKKYVDGIEIRGPTSSPHSHLTDRVVFYLRVSREQDQQEGIPLALVIY
jgi:hypothetical protein